MACLLLLKLLATPSYLTLGSARKPPQWNTRLGTLRACLVASATYPMLDIAISAARFANCTRHCAIDKPIGDTIRHSLSDVECKLESTRDLANRELGVLDDTIDHCRASWQLSILHCGRHRIMQNSPNGLLGAAVEGDLCAHFLSRR